MASPIRLRPASRFNSAFTWAWDMPVIRARSRTTEVLEALQPGLLFHQGLAAAAAIGPDRPPPGSWGGAGSSRTSAGS